MSFSILLLPTDPPFLHILAVTKIVNFMSCRDEKYYFCYRKVSSINYHSIKNSNSLQYSPHWKNSTRIQYYPRSHVHNWFHWSFHTEYLRMITFLTIQNIIFFLTALFIVYSRPHGLSYLELFGRFISYSQFQCYIGVVQSFEVYEE